MKTELKEIRIFVCEVCGEEYILMEDAPKKCLKSTIIDFTDGAKVGDAVRTNLFGEENGYELIGRVLEIQERGHERGMLVKDYMSNSTIYLGESNHDYWYVLNDAKLDVLIREMNVELDIWKRMNDENPKPKVD